MPSTLSAAEIISIIQACNQNAVSKFTLGELDVQFTGYRPPVSQTAAYAQQVQDEHDWADPERIQAPSYPEGE